MSRLATPRALSAGRVVIGGSMVLSPTTVPQVLGVDRVSAGRTAWAMQMLGVRDLALGVGALVALQRKDDRGARVWLAAGLLSDAVDALAIARAVGRGTVTRGAGTAGVAVAVGAVAVGAAALAADDLE